MMNIYKLPLILEPQPEGGYTITCPLLPNLITEADTFEEVMPHVADALTALIEAYHDLREPLPPVLQPLSTQTPIWAETLVSMEAVRIANGIIRKPEQLFPFPIGGGKT